MGLQNKTILILGGTSGIGLCVAKLLKGDNKVIVVGHDIEKLQRLQESSSGIECLQADLSIPADVKDIFDNLKRDGIKLDALVYSAGISPLCLLKDNTIDLMEKVFRINYFSFLEACRLFADPQYSEDGSRIVAVSSVTSKESGYRQTLYGSSKAAMISAVKQTAPKLWERGITINAISPGVTRTDIFERLAEKSKDLEANTILKQPIGILDPIDVAKEIIRYISGEAGKVTGTEVIFDGGYGLH